MREILFRGIPIDGYNGFSLMWNDNCKDGFVYGSLVISKNRYYISVSAVGCSKNSNLNNGITSMIEVQPETVGQYIGLTDKKGNKIFEGDIVTNHESGLWGKVVYTTAQDGFDGMCGFMVDDIHDGLQNYNGFWHLVTVIGNVYKNPNLLLLEEENDK